MKISPARIAAFDILQRIETEKAFSSVLLPLYEDGLIAADRSLCHELTLGVLRSQILLDAVIDQLTDKRKIDASVRLAIRLGLYQLRFLGRVPDYSAINESVNLTQRAKKTSAKAFVNAILRKATREWPELSFRDEIERISVESSHPRWLIERWALEFGRSEADEIARANNQIPQVAFRVNGDSSGETLDLIAESRPSTKVKGCFIVNHRNPRLGALAEAGRIYVQDEGSQLVANAVSIPQNGLFLDVCAAPGGKTGLIANRFSKLGLTTVAGDLHWQRVEFLRDNCSRQNVKGVGFVQYNAEKCLPFREQTFDRVLADVPCSGTGTIRHNPELRYFLNPEDFADLAAKQLSILKQASNLVKVGGMIIYSTCSFEREENEDVCRSFLADRSDFMGVKPDVAERFFTNDGYARTWPHRDEMDGFFIAAFERRH